MTAEVLVVCTANVCRSPVAAALLDRRVHASGRGDLVVRSAGTAAVTGAGVCPEAVRLLLGAEDGAPDGGDPLSSHAARPVDRAALRAADLVLVMTRDHRAAVAALDPLSRSRTFTLREAATLGEAVGVGDAADVTRLVEAMDAARGLVPLAAAPPSGSWRRLRRRRTEVDAGVDVADAHTDRVSHAAVAALLDDSVARLAAVLAGPRRVASG
ncbi:hypothetical protein [Aquipuribacter nitratireducens]|uniref:Phosphotyrosine protein phosphatase I domain-containing protein n=1 Tax=Aquipuribacter nitratireducens TaxID=650104 RepID=A0ABW0GQS9_9MICO